MKPKLVIIASDVCIDGVVIVDPVLARVLSEAQGEDERLSLFADIVEVGARVIQQRQDGDQGAMIRREIDRLSEMMSQSRTEILESAGEDFAGAIGQVMTMVSQQLSSISGRLEGALAVGQTVSKAQAEIERERERGTAKGRDYEETVAMAIGEIAAHSGDSFEHVGDVAGFQGKAGDILVQIDAARGPSRGSLVFEVKTGRLTGPEAMRELDRARAQRDADFAVLVVPAPEKLPAGTRMLVEYGGDKLMATYDPEGSPIVLEAAYSLARARVLLEEAMSDEIDVATARVSIEKLLLLVDGMRNLKGSLTSAQRSLEGMKDNVETLEQAIRGHIDDVARALKLSD